MKARPRRIENKVAEYISEHLLYPRKLSKVSRIPVLGRTGPDMDILPMVRVAVDVKSRKANPKGYKLEAGQIRFWWDIEGSPQIGCRLEDLDLLFDIENEEADNRPCSRTVLKWLVHMDDWCNENRPVLPALVLHWPGTPVKHSTFVIFNGDRRTLNDRRKRFDNLLV